MVVKESLLNRMPKLLYASRIGKVGIDSRFTYGEGAKCLGLPMTAALRRARKRDKYAALAAAIQELAGAAKCVSNLLHFHVEAAICPGLPGLRVTKLRKAAPLPARAGAHEQLGV